MIATGAAVASFAALGLVLRPGISDAHEIQAGAVVQGAHGERLGTVHFTVLGNKTLVNAHLRLPSGTRWDAFHGFHIHANDKPANGSGCLADPSKPAATWFASADGHLAAVGQTHGEHAGDLPGLLVNRDGTADLAFTTQRFTLSDLHNRVVVVHAGADNEGNVPLGKGAEQYTANSAAARTKTAGTGNAGDRIGCGLIQVTAGW